MDNNTTDPTGNMTSGLSAPEIITFSFLLIVLELTIIVGNIFVCLAVIYNKKLHSVTYYFIFVQAVFDLSLAVIVLPFSSLWTLHDLRWPFGLLLCNLWVSFDVFLCTLSILNLFGISIERYICITRPFWYQRHVSKRIIVYAVCIEITLSLFSSFIPIFTGWNVGDGTIQNSENPELCRLHGSKGYVLTVAIVTYFIPLILLSLAHCRVLIVAHEQAKRVKEESQGLYYRRSKRKRNMLTIIRSLFRRRPRTATGSISVEATNAEPQPRREPTTSAHSNSALLSIPTGGMMMPNIHHNRHASMRVQRRVMQRERKAILTLAGIIIAFVICWVPYFTVFTIEPFMVEAGQEVDGTMYLIFYWLGMFNSALNPFLYAVLNSEFRLTFKQLICCRRHIGFRTNMFPSSDPTTTNNLAMTTLTLS